MYRYFSVSSAKLALLTNGVEYMLFTDAVEKNKMDTEPFYSFNMQNISSGDIDIIKMLHKSNIGDMRLVSYSKTNLFRHEIDNWYNTEKLDLSRSFVEYIKGVVSTFGLSDDEIKTIVHSKLFGNVVTINKKETKDSDGVRSSLKLVDNNLETTCEGSGKDGSKKSAVGKTGVFRLSSEDLLDAISGSTVVFVRIGDKEFDYNKTYQLLFAFIDYMLDIRGVTPSDIIMKNSSLDMPIFMSYNSDKSLREYRDISFKGAISGVMVIKYLVKQCELFGVDINSVYVGLLDKNTVQNLKSINMNESLWKSYLKNLQMKSEEK